MTEKDKQINNNHIKYGVKALDANMSVNPFGQNTVTDIAYKKAERLALATHLVTNFVPENENVRNKVRTCSQTLLTLTMQLHTGAHNNTQKEIVRIYAQVRLILSLLDVIHASGYISDMNLEVLKYAYADLARFIGKSVNTPAAEQFELQEEFFLSVKDSQGQVSHGQKDNGQKAVTDKKITDKIKDIKPIKDTQTEKNKRPQSLRTKRRTTSRRMAILDVITKTSPIHISDIAKEVTNCSEKTIQRELASLVRDGVIKKEGAKRWTMYSLVV